MRSALVAPFAACALAALVPQAAIAQAAAAPDSLPFRAGQWAAEFAVSSAMPAVGVLRFRSPSSAWLLNGQLDVGRSTQSNDLGEQDATTTSATIQVGLRAYRPVAARVTRYHGTGLLLAYQRHNAEFGPELLYFNRTTSMGPGAYGELGAGVAVTPYLHLGAAASLELRYLWGSQERTVSPGTDQEEEDISQLRARLGPVRLVATLFF